MKISVLSRATILVLLGFGVTISTQLRADDLPVPNAGFEDIGPETSSSGAPMPAEWHLSSWSKTAGSTEQPPAGVSTDHPREGAQSVFIGTSKEGASGWVSTSFTIPDNVDTLHLEVYGKESRDYAGNRPWVFITWFKGPDFLNKTDAVIPNTMLTGDWTKIILEIKASDIPPGADHFQINLASAFNQAGNGEISGQVNYDALKLSFTTK